MATRYFALPLAASAWTTKTLAELAATPTIRVLTRVGGVGSWVLVAASALAGADTVRALLDAANAWTVQPAPSLQVVVDFGPADVGWVVPVGVTSLLVEVWSAGGGGGGGAGVGPFAGSGGGGGGFGSEIRTVTPGTNIGLTIGTGGAGGIGGLNGDDGGATFVSNVVDGWTLFVSSGTGGGGQNGAGGVAGQGFGIDINRFGGDGFASSTPVGGGGGGGAGSTADGSDSTGSAGGAGGAGDGGAGGAAASPGGVGAAFGGGGAGGSGVTNGGAGADGHVRITYTP
jgi:hypothetical protein